MLTVLMLFVLIGSFLLLGGLVRFSERIVQPRSTTRQIPLAAAAHHLTGRKEQ